MQLISRKSDVIYLTGIHFEAEREIQLLISGSKIYVLCDPRNSARIEKIFPKDQVLATHTQQEAIIKKAKKIQVDPTDMTVDRLAKLKKLNPNITYKKDAVAKNRQIKTKDEIEKIVHSQRINEQVLKNILPQIYAGISESQLEKLLRIEQLKLGAEGPSFTPIVAFEEGGANPHHHNRPDRKLKKGDQILLDMGVIVDGYCSDMTRVIYTDTPTDLQKEILDLLIRATKETIRYGEAGMTGAYLHRFCANLLGKYKKYFIHSLGHGIGIDIHELPYLSPKKHGKIRDGMVFTIEPGIYISDVIGSRYEQMVVVEDGKLRCLTNAPEILEIDI